MKDNQEQLLSLSELICLACAIGVGLYAINLFVFAMGG